MSENDRKNRHHINYVSQILWTNSFANAYTRTASTKTAGLMNLPSTVLHYGNFGSPAQKRLKIENATQRNEIIRLVLSFVIIPFRYPSAHAPHNHFTMPLTHHSHGHFHQSIIPAHGINTPTDSQTWTPPRSVPRMSTRRVRRHLRVLCPWNCKELKRCETYLAN
ncbi:hypothetical protein BDR04DRAFT_1096817 [Suillus decipiens]|nr:hypothetical protein BDR04DRAFT_1096817 [Suillus decipiens]